MMTETMICDKKVSLPENSTVLQALCQAASAQGALAAMNGFQVSSLTDIVPANASIKPLDMNHEEGRRVYERTLRMVMLTAARRLWPEQRVRIEYSSGYGVYVRMPGRIPDT